MVRDAKVICYYTAKNGFQGWNYYKDHVNSCRVSYSFGKAVTGSFLQTNSGS